MFKHIVKGWKTIEFLNGIFLNKYKDDYLFFSDTRDKKGNWNLLFYVISFFPF